MTSAEVADALASGMPVVALESTIFSPFGLPAPANEEALDRCIAAVRAAGAIPAVTAVLDGQARVGLDPDEHERILRGGRKVAERDLAVAIARGESVGVTTVSASLALAAATGIDVFATGGIGGVHRGVEETGDVSADLGALARHSVVTVCAGAKAFLDLPRTLEYLETSSVAVLGWRTDEFPMFWCRSSGLPVSDHVEHASEVAAVLRARRALDLPQGVVLAVPVPSADAIDVATIDGAIRTAAEASVRAGERGAAVTPHILAAIAEATEGRSVAANLSLAEHNAVVAAEVARAFTAR
ncbi:MAG: pseudouridine-5'-phosphate glycosidase [Acidimicrobiia bacterium]